MLRVIQSDLAFQDPFLHIKIVLSGAFLTFNSLTIYQDFKNSFYQNLLHEDPIFSDFSISHSYFCILVFIDGCQLLYSKLFFK